MAIENFGVSTLIIPMDATYQNNGMFRAYGLVYNLLSNGIPVKWAIQSGKSFNGTDFTASATDFQSGTTITNHNYSGGPFIIDSAFAATAAPFITAWQAANTNVKVHVATAPFSADIAATMQRAPRIAVEATNAGIVLTYLNAAGIPDSLGHLWNTSSPGVLSETEIAAGAFFGYDLTACRRSVYDIFLSPHTGTSSWNDPVMITELNDWLYQGGFLHAMCESIPSIENTAGPFLTQSGIPITDVNKGDTGTFKVTLPDFPTVQAVNTTSPQGLPGGSFQTIYHNTPGLVYNSQTQILAYFTQTSTGKQYDFTLAGPYKNGAGAGKVVYEGGHQYTVSLPYTGNMENMYTRFVLDDLFFAVGKPLMYLEFNTGNPNNELFVGQTNTITFAIANTGASPALSTGFTVTLIPGMTYNNDATIPPTSIAGQTLSWTPAALGNVSPGTVLTFTASYTPALTGSTQLATFSTSFGDENNENFNIGNQCVKTTAVTAIRPAINLSKTVDKNFATYGDTLTYTVNLVNGPTGTATATNVVFIDPIPAGTTFVSGSVTVNGVPVAGDPSVGIPLPDVPPSPAPGSTVVVTFQVTVNNMATPQDVVNQAFTNFQYTVDGITYSGYAQSNTVVTVIRVGEITLAKSTDKSVVAVGDIITYTTDVTNTGNVVDFNTTFFDNPPAGTNFIPGTVFVNGVNLPGASPIAGIPLGDLPVSTPDSPNVTEVSFQVEVTSIPAPPTLTNTASATFLWRVNPTDQPTIPGSGTSNPVIAQAVNPEITIVKSTNSAFANIGDVITYTQVITNTGDVTANNVIFTDNPPAGTTFVPGSVTINGAPNPGNPSIGIPLGNMAPGAAVTVTFQVTATSIPVPNPTTNISNISGQFTIEPGEPPRTLDFNSNPVDVSIQQTGLDVVKSVDKIFAEVGEPLTYTVVVTNTSSIPANNAVLSDIVPNGTTFVPGSVTINTAPSGANPATGIPLGNIPTGGSITVTFQATLTAIPVPNPAVNTASVNADFPVNPQNPLNLTFQSNPVSTRAEIAQLNIVKTVDKAFAEVGDILTYTVTITNTGTIVANDVTVTDPPPAGTSFVGGSVTINGIPNAAANPITGINAGSIPSGGSTTINFKVHVDSVPVPNPASNISIVSGSFPVDPNNPVIKEFESNPADTIIEIARLSIVKSVDKPILNVGDIATYTTVITNTGTVPANNVVFTDTPPGGTTFVPNSVTVNGLPIPLANPAVGIDVGNIPVAGAVTVTFQVTVNSIPTPNPTNNISAVTGSFPVNPASPTQKDFESNPVPVQIELAQLELTKSIDKPFAEIGETVNYAVEVKNTGTVPAINVIFTDTPPAGTQFVPASVTVNGVPTPGNPLSGIPLPNIPAGEAVIVAFNVTVVAVPTPNPSVNVAKVDAEFVIDPTKPPINISFPSNPVNQVIIFAQLDVVKSVDKAAASVGDTLTYTIVVTNTGNVNSNNTAVYDLVPAGTVFVPNSLSINNTPQPGVNPNNGVSLGTLIPGQSAIITFNVTVDSLPVPPEAVNSATAEFEYIVNPAEPPRSKTMESNEVITRIEKVGLELSKSADKNYVIRGDIITYTVQITNTGTVPVNNVIFKDPIPAGTVLVENSFAIGGKPVPGANPEEGVHIGTIAPGQTVTVSFLVRYEYRPCPPIIRNTAFAEFNFRIVSSGPVEVGAAESNTTETEASPTNFKQLSVDENLTIPIQKPDAEDILNTIVDVVIVETRVINTMVGTSEEGQVLTGKKLLIESVLHQKVEYVANDPTQSVHTAEFNVPFSSFIILPINFEEGSPINVTAYVEDVYVKLLDERHIFKNVTLRLEADIGC